MRYIWQATWKAGVTREQGDAALMRRAGWSYPQGMSVTGEYWLMGTPTVILIFETSEIEPIFELDLTWGDVFDTTTSPVLTPEEGLRIGPEIVSRRGG